MSKARSLNETMYAAAEAEDMPSDPSDPSVSGRKRVLTQFAVSGNAATAVGQTQPRLDTGVYEVVATMTGTQFVKKATITDALLRFSDPRQDLVLEEISRFWGLKGEYDKYGFIHSRGIVLYGPPGSGKSCIVKLVTEQMVKDGNIVLYVSSPSALISALGDLREVEPERKVLVVLEDLDELARYSEHALLELFDGDKKIDNVCYLATTNFINRISPRMLRPPRFDRKVEVPMPPIEGRRAYLQMKLGKYQPEELIEEIAGKTDGFSFGHLRELIVSVFCLKQDLESTLQRLGSEDVQRLSTKGWSEKMVENRLSQTNKRIKRLDESRTSEAQVNFSRYIKPHDRNSRVLDTDEPLFGDVSPEDLMDMTGSEIRKMWSDLPSDVAYNLSDFFNKDQLQALTRHPDGRLARDARSALLGESRVNEESPLQRIAKEMAGSGDYSHSTQTAAYGISLAFSRAPTSVLSVLKALNDKRAKSLFDHLVKTIQDGDLDSQGDVKDYLVGMDWEEEMGEVLRGSKARSLLNVVEQASGGYSGLDLEGIQTNLTRRIEQLGIEGIFVDSVDKDMEGNLYVDLSDSEDNLLSLAFSYDETDGAQAIVLDSDKETIVVDLGPLGVSVIDTEFGKYVDLLNLSWLNKATLLSLIAGSDLFPDDTTKPAVVHQDAYGNVLGQAAEGFVSRGKGKMRMPVLHKRKMEKLSYKQRMAKHHKLRTTEKKRVKKLYYKTKVKKG